ncbi:MAG: U32 family peptidase [Oscillibacter sp.]|jgi:putative protease|nr:U32 family peptidase [Oscillibacter sp.]
MELLSPAGSPEALRAAVQSGADAVYLGWGDFNARRNAQNFSEEEFSDAVIYCHERGVRVFLTLNTLLTDRELPQALETAHLAALLGVDAVLVQDWGLFALLRSAMPDLPLHASTQMSIFTSGGACEAAAMGCERVVIARECSKADTQTICKACPAEIEIFGHGALCMCYSGQCAMSALIGGRSGNRGKCAQPCRLPYGVDGPAKNQHPLSLKDSCLASHLGEMEGVSCLKIEGRMKRPEYVSVVTEIYARLLNEQRAPTKDEQQKLEAAFSRQGFTDGYWLGHRGNAMFGSRSENTPEPTALFAAAKEGYEKDRKRLVPVEFFCTVKAGEPAALKASDPDGHTVTVTGPVPEAARNHALTAEELSERLGKTGGTAYACKTINVDVGEGLSLPAAAVNALRRDALEGLRAIRCAMPERKWMPDVPAVKDHSYSGAPRLTASVVSWKQITPELLAGLTRIYVPVEVLAAQETLPEFSGEWCAVLPRIWRDGDEELLKELLARCTALGVTGVLLGNLGHFPLVAGSNFHRYGDFGLNVFNSRSLAFLQKKGLESGCVSFELRQSQIRDLAKPMPTEAIVYGRLPLMITENCLVKNAYNCGCDKQGACVSASGRCAGRHYLNDRTGASFPLLPAFGHRTEIENCKVLYLADRTDWEESGLAFARLRFTTESAEECAEVLERYLSHAKTPKEFTRGLYDRGVE